MYEFKTYVRENSNYLAKAELLGSLKIVFYLKLWYHFKITELIFYSYTYVTFYPLFKTTSTASKIGWRHIVSPLTGITDQKSPMISAHKGELFKIHRSVVVKKDRFALENETWPVVCGWIFLEVCS